MENYLPLTVIIIDLSPPWFLCSQRYIPCQTPRASFPFSIGMHKEDPNIDDLICAGISSGPSNVCLYYGWFSGINLLKWFSKSCLTVGSELSFIDIDAEVCWINKFNNP